MKITPIAVAGTVLQVATKINEIKTFDKFMWDTFSRCDRWLTGTAEEMEPCYTVVSCEERTEWLFIAIPSCIEAYSDDYPGEVYRLNINFPTQAAAATFLRGINHDFTFASLGFKGI